MGAMGGRMEATKWISMRPLACKWHRINRENELP